MVNVKTSKAHLEESGIGDMVIKNIVLVVKCICPAMVIEMVSAVHVAAKSYAKDQTIKQRSYLSTL